MKDKKQFLALSIFWALVILLGGGALVASAYNSKPALEETEIEVPATDTEEVSLPPRIVTISCADPSDEDEGVKALLEDYLRAREDAEADLAEADLGGFFADAGEGARETGVLSALIGCRRMQRGDLRMQTCSVTGVIGPVVRHPDGEMEISVRVTEGVTFNETANRVSVCGPVEHKMVLTPTAEGLRIRSDSYDDPVRGYFDEALGDETPNAENVGQIKLEYLGECSGNLEEFWSYDLSGEIPEGCTPYDRQAAAAWAEEHALVRDGSKADFTDLGGNCQNYASLTLKAGGIPDDASGASWCEGDLESATPSFYRVDDFCSYATENATEGTGLMAAVGLGIYNTEMGDVIQNGSQGEFVHSSVVTDIVVDRDGGREDVLVSSNTTARLNWPLSAMGCPDMRAVHVAGYFGG